MSKWTDVRDAIENDVVASGLDEAVKKQMLDVLTKEAMPAAEAAVDKMCAGLVADAKAETGWCRMRDAVVLPCALRGLLWIMKQGMERTLDETA